MSILRSCAISFATRAFRTCGFQRRSAASTPSLSSRPASSISPNAKNSQSKIEELSGSMRALFHSLSNRAARLLMKLLFGCVASVRVVRPKIANQEGSFLLAGNHISHFDPFIISSLVRRKIDWMAMAEFFPLPLLGFLLRAGGSFPAERDRSDRKTIRTAIERLKKGRIVGIFPEGGIRDGARSVLEGAPLRPGASTLPHLAGCSVRIWLA